jgi:hypothetical protein
VSAARPRYRLSTIWYQAASDASGVHTVNAGTTGGMSATPERPRRRWSEQSRAQRYAFVQTQLLFWVLYAVAVYLVATHVGVVFAVVVFGVGLASTALAMVIGMRMRRNRDGRR